MSEAGYTSEAEVDSRAACGSTQAAGASSVRARAVEALDSVVIRFVGDSGDGMQLTGSEFSKAVAKAGHGFATHPDYPSEIRAPTGTLFGVSGYQIQYGSRQVFTSGDAPDALVAMNPAALKTNLADVKHGGIIIANTGAFADTNLAKAGYTSNPLEDGSLDGYRLFRIDISALTAAALRDSGLSKKEVGRCKNYFALGLMLCLYGRPIEDEIADIYEKFAKKPEFADANVNALRAGFAYADAAEIFAATYQVREAAAKPGIYRSITGNHAAALGFVAASESSGVGLFLGSYPITPATDILHELSALKHFNVTTYQAEDEIAGICSTIGAAYGGALGLTTTSGPGMALKTEAMGLAVMLELPLVIVNVQRGGPSTGLPTKIEQSDLLQAIYGRNGECPIPVIAARSPADCFDCAIEAFRIAVKYMTPVILLTDGGIANAAEPWRIPDVASLPKVEVSYRTDPEGFQPYARDENLARAWVRPGTPGMEHRVGGLEKDFLTGNISHDPLNHQRMVDVRAAKVAGTAQDIPPTTVEGPASGDLLVIGWGSTYGTIAQAREKAEADGRSVAHVHLRHLNPLPPDLGDLLARYKTVLVPELNMGQLSKLLRERYLCDVVPLNKVQGKPFKVSEIHDRILELS
ncbi:2-oxoglutarate ferredoxin oxidoreductase alpha subunit [Aromatoleum aromaticum EbN1]|uniref:2-oxoglutarate ferredoxin oxidoreductase alpha subunit n=1 Tax=Aromatoleum aromaticum (strain DSM 19018 / LMG 30748 / EbN1) TaxID=76114 RepID=Q5P472_AROAE|nr:2-oxoacid:acceptor oxidoreductase subunit alpha [Aromatoleum aromaticum]CAI07891.1 2-oxoglutarate ferredoxin oxidoreductase alpha subunit [Aromatoleum aromaticum EbN1]